MAEKVGFSSVIKNSGFRYLWFNQILVQLAYNALNFTLIIWVYKLVDNNLAVSALMLTIYLPAVIFGIFAGVFVDIFDRKKIILLIDLLIALAFIMFIFIKGSFISSTNWIAWGPLLKNATSQLRSNFRPISWPFNCP